MNIKKILLLILCTSFSINAFAESHCDVKEKRWYRAGEISCSFKSVRIASSSITSREVKYQVPLGEAPYGGWPVAIIYQGTNSPVEFTQKSTALFGVYYEVETIKRLLDNGYAVIAPRAVNDLAWLTNMASVVGDNFYHLTTDYTFLTNVFQGIRDGQFGELNADKKYATGLSSGGYNTSRMAVSFPGEFKALVVHSASYAECLAAACIVPSLPEDHPPTFFIHGFYDPIVPWFTMDTYFDRLLWQGIETDRHTNYLGGHGWFPESAELVTDWFERYQ